MVKWHKKDVPSRMYCVIEDGKKISMPRYYKEKIYTDEEREIIGYEFQKKYAVDLEKYNNSQDYILKERGREAAIFDDKKRLSFQSNKTKI